MRVDLNEGRAACFSEGGFQALDKLFAFTANAGDADVMHGLLKIIYFDFDFGAEVGDLFILNALHRIHIIAAAPDGDFAGLVIHAHTCLREAIIVSSHTAAGKDFEKEKGQRGHDQKN